MSYPNRYYQETFNATFGTLGRSSALETQFRAIEYGFSLIKDDLNSILAFRTFLALLDTPDSYAGQAGKLVKVNTAENALEFGPAGDASRLRVASFADTTYTPALIDAQSLLVSLAGTAVTFTVPTNATRAFAVGDMIAIAQKGAGQVTLSPAGGVTLRSTDNKLSTRKQYAQIAIIYLGGDEWQVMGERNTDALNYASLILPNVFTAGSNTVTPVALTDGATINTNASLSNHFRVTLGGNRTLANPTNLQDGQIITYKIKQDGTGGRTLAFGSMFKWVGGIAPTLTATAGARDFLSVQYFADEGILVGVLQPDVR